jgi:hypothetical protein
MKIVSGDIGRSPVPIRHSENVEVLGSVRSGARLEVEGSLSVYGDVEDAEVIARGDVFIEGGFLGGRGNMMCGGFKARFVQGQRVQAGGDIEIERAMVSANVYCSGSVTVKGDDGAIVGGRVRAFHGIEVGTLGARRPVSTAIEVGVDPLAALRIDELENEAMELTRRRIGILRSLMYATRNEGGKQSAVDVVDMKATTEAIQGHIATIGEEIIKLRTTTELDPEAFVRVRRAAFPPLDITVCFSRLTNDNETGPATFRLVGDQIQIDRHRRAGGL